MSIKIGILGYGNLGKGIECAIKHNPDMELVAVFTRRNPESVPILTEKCFQCFQSKKASSMKNVYWCVNFMWRECHRPSNSDTRICQIFQCGRQLWYPCKYPWTFWSCGQSRQREWTCCYHLCWLGPRYVFFKPPVCQCNFTRRSRFILSGAKA